MSEQTRESEKPEAPDDPFLNPRPLSAAPVLLDYSRPLPGEDLVTLSKMPSMEAELASMKLRSRGVPAFIADQNIATSNPYVFPYVTLQVQQADLEQAKAILAEPASVDADGEYAEEAWRCPKCHRKTVRIQPMSPKWKTALYVFLLMIPLPLLVEMVGPALPDEIYFTVRSMGSVYVLALAALGAVLLLRKRHKACTTCAHEWS